MSQCNLYGHKQGCKGYHDKQCDIYSVELMRKTFDSTQNKRLSQ